MAKICVITFANTTDNYGQVLQYLATQEYLKGRGHDSYLLRSKGHKKSILAKAIRKLKRHIFPPKPVVLSERERKQMEEFGKWWTVAAEMEANHPRHFEDFRKKEFKLLDTYLEDVQKYAFDAVAVGSDQTWGSSDDAYYLGWAPKEYTRFAIAPSVAHYQFSEDEIKRLRPDVQQFSFITVREQNGLTFCDRIGYKGAEQILDPTFLLPSSGYDRFLPTCEQNQKPYLFLYLLGNEIGLDGYKGAEQILDPTFLLPSSGYDRFLPTCEQNQKPYLFLYLLGNEIGLDIKEIFEFAKSKGLEVKYVASQGRTDSFPKVYAEVGEWLGLLKNATYVITNSFHGMAFSVIYRKRFLTIPVVGIFEGMNVRIENIASQFKLSNRIYTGNLDEIEKNIDWNEAERIISENKLLLDTLMTKVKL